jgi:hypothetical protein
VFVGGKGEEDCAEVGRKADYPEESTVSFAVVMVLISLLKLWSEDVPHRASATGCVLLLSTCK